MHPEICARARALSMLAHLVPNHHPELRGWFQQFFDETPSCGPDANNPRVFFGTFVCCCCLSGPVKAPHQSSGLVEQYPGLRNVCNLIGLAFFCFFVDFFFSYWPHIGVTVGCFWKTSWTTSRKKIRAGGSSEKLRSSTDQVSWATWASETRRMGWGPWRRTPNNG